MNEVTLGAEVNTFTNGPDFEVDLTTSNAVSFELLSTHVRFIRSNPVATADTFDGAFGVPVGGVLVSENAVVGTFTKVDEPGVFHCIAIDCPPACSKNVAAIG